MVSAFNLTRRFVNLLETGLFIMVIAVRIFHTPNANAETDCTPAAPFCQGVPIPYQQFKVSIFGG